MDLYALLQDSHMDALKADMHWIGAVGGSCACPTTPKVGSVDNGCDEGGSHVPVRTLSLDPICTCLPLASHVQPTYLVIASVFAFSVLLPAVSSVRDPGGARAGDLPFNCLATGPATAPIVFLRLLWCRWISAFMW